MFHFSTFALYLYAFKVKYPCGWVAPFGNPRITALLPAPLGLSQVHASFIASQCQDIHRAPLLLDHTNRLPRLHQLSLTSTRLPINLTLCARAWPTENAVFASFELPDRSGPSGPLNSAPTIVLSFIAVFALSIQTSVTFLPSRERPAARHSDKHPSRCRRPRACNSSLPIRMSKKAVASAFRLGDCPFPSRLSPVGVGREV